MSDHLHTDDEIMHEAASLEEYKRYFEKSENPLPYLEWKYRQERKSEVAGLQLW